MRSGDRIVFENGNIINLKENIITSNYRTGFTHIGIKHTLTANELNELLNQPIEDFSVIGRKKEFDKWERKNILSAIQNLYTEHY